MSKEEEARRKQVLRLYAALFEDKRGYATYEEMANNAVQLRYLYNQAKKILLKYAGQGAPDAMRWIKENNIK